MSAVDYSLIFWFTLTHTHAAIQLLLSVYLFFFLSTLYMNVCIYVHIGINKRLKRNTNTTAEKVNNNIGTRMHSHTDRYTSSEHTHAHNATATYQRLYHNKFCVIFWIKMRNCIENPTMQQQSASAAATMATRATISSTLWLCTKRLRCDVYIWIICGCASSLQFHSPSRPPMPSIQPLVFLFICNSFLLQPSPSPRCAQHRLQCIFLVVSHAHSMRLLK